MIKKVILLSILIVLIGGGAVIFLTTKHSASSSGTLSERSKAFLAEQQKNGESDLKYARIGQEDKAGAFVGKRVDIGDCFSFVMVFRVTNPREDADCSWYFGIEQPKGMITAYMRPAATISSVDQVDGVSMRRQFTDKYKESKRVVKGVTYLIFTGTDPQKYEVNAFALVNKKALFFNLLTQTPDNYDPQFQSMLDSIEVK